MTSGRSVTGRATTAPAAGQRRVTAVSPNLRLYTDLSTQDCESLLRITPTSGSGPDTYLTIAGSASGAAWSPDGNRLVVPVRATPDDARPEHSFTAVSPGTRPG